jgi:mannan endo-1,4-beta-mannosidase
MSLKQIIAVAFVCLLLPSTLYAQQRLASPTVTNTSPEAKALLQLLYNLSGNYTLTGQHNFPSAKDRNSKFAADYSGKTPVIWSTDMGFAKEGDKDSYLKRSALVEEAIRQNKKGAIVTICWHAVPPTANEPITFQSLPGALKDSLASVQGRLTEKQFTDILTPGTALNKHWEAQVDTIAFYLKQLQDAHVPVLWRPYHEMNGNWFWWGGRTGQYSTQALYRQLFDRLVNYHKLTNLIWVWSVDRPTKPEMAFANYYPGNRYLDIVALDVYGSDFKKDYYDELVALANGKPVTLAEVGNPPSSEVMKIQPKWSYWVIWAGMVRNTSKKQFRALASDPRLLGLNDPAYIDAANPFRKTFDLPQLPVPEPADFSGEWILNEDKSTLDNFGVGNLPAKLTIKQDEKEMAIQKAYVEEFENGRVTDEKMTLDGQENKSEYMNSPRVITANLSADGDVLKINSKTTTRFGGQEAEILSDESWSLSNHGKSLTITQSSSSPYGKRNITLVYDKQ